MAIRSFIDSESGEPKAIFVVNGVTLLAVVQQVIDMGIRMSEEIGVCGYDDWAWAPFDSTWRYSHRATDLPSGLRKRQTGDLTVKWESGSEAKDDSVAVHHNPPRFRRIE